MLFPTTTRTKVYSQYTIWGMYHLVSQVTFTAYLPNYNFWFENLHRFQLTVLEIWCHRFDWTIFSMLFDYTWPTSLESKWSQISSLIRISKEHLQYWRFPPQWWNMQKCLLCLGTYTKMQSNAIFQQKYRYSKIVPVTPKPLTKNFRDFWSGF